MYSRIHSQGVHVKHTKETHLADVELLTAVCHHHHDGGLLHLAVVLAGLCLADTQANSVGLPSAVTRLPHLARGLCSTLKQYFNVLRAMMVRFRTYTTTFVVKSLHISQHPLPLDVSTIQQLATHVQNYLKVLWKYMYMYMYMYHHFFLLPLTTWPKVRIKKMDS